MTNCLFKFNIASKKEKIFYASLIINGVIFLIVYYFLSFKNTSSFYNQYNTGGWKFIVQIFTENKILLFCFCMCAIRMFYVIIKKERSTLYYDSILFAGTSYVFAYILLRLNFAYYFTPAIILFLPSLVYWAKYLYQKRKNYSLLFFSVIIICYIYINYHGIIIDNVIHNFRDRRECIKYFTCLLINYHQGKKFIWYESDNTINDDQIYIVIRRWRKIVKNIFLNYVNKTAGHDFFVLQKEVGAVEFHKDILFFYPSDNDQNQPMPERLVRKLGENHFELHKDAYGIFVYKKKSAAF
jgi:hypothetical protein